MSEGAGKRLWARIAIDPHMWRRARLQATCLVAPPHEASYISPVVGSPPTVAGKTFGVVSFGHTHADDPSDAKATPIHEIRCSVRVFTCEGRVRCRCVRVWLVRGEV